MAATYFSDVEPVRYAGPETDNPLAYRWYDPKRVVLGKTMEEHLRIAVCYWHTFCSNGSDIFGGGTFDRPWQKAGDPVAMAEMKLEEAMSFVQKLGVPFYTFHDRDLAPELGGMRESQRAFAHMVDKAAAAQERTGVKLLWGTANLFSHPRYMAGAATNPDPPKCSPVPRCRCATRWKPRIAWAAPATCCGAAARGMTRCSIQTSSGRWRNSAVFSPWSSSTSTRSALPATS